MLTQYIQEAMRLAVVEYDDEDRKWYGEIPDCRGVIGVGDDEESARRDTQEALEGWIIIGLRFGDPLPVLGGVDLNVREAA